MTARYFAHITPAGPIRYGQFPCAIGVLDAPDHPKAIGMAFEVGWDDGGLAVWRLMIRGAEVPGRWVIVDREFRPVEGARERVSPDDAAGRGRRPQGSRRTPR